MDVVNEFFAKNRAARHGAVYPRMKCADGFSMSVQGHFGAYCSPREDVAPHYSMVEVGYPSEREADLMPYAEDAEHPTDTVYGYVPVDVVAAVIAKHGGLVSDWRTRHTAR